MQSESFHFSTVSNSTKTDLMAAHLIPLANTILNLAQKVRTCINELNKLIIKPYLIIFGPVPMFGV